MDGSAGLSMEALGERITARAGDLAATTCAYLQDVAVFDAGGGWRGMELDCERSLVEVATSCTAAQLDRLCAGLRGARSDVSTGSDGAPAAGVSRESSAGVWTTPPADVAGVLITDVFAGGQVLVDAQDVGGRCPGPSSIRRHGVGRSGREGRGPEALHRVRGRGAEGRRAAAPGVACPLGPRRP